MSGTRILAIRLGAMGDVIHALPAVASLKHGFPHCRLTWIVETRWAPLLDDNPFVDEVLAFDRQSLRGILTARRLLGRGFDIAVDLQGLIKSALVAAFSRAERIVGFHQSQLRERLAGLFYSHKTMAQATHIVDRYLELAASAGATSAVRVFPLPKGQPEGELPDGPFVLANPLAGWPGKQWPLEYWETLGARLRDVLGLTLVLNVPSQAWPDRPAGVFLHASGLPGLIDATRRAVAVAGIDSGPVHLAAALGKPGVAIFGPTDPARNGPYGGTMTVLRSPHAVTTYKRRAEIDRSMYDISPDMAFEALKARLVAGCAV